MDNTYIYLSSSDSSKAYPNNTPGSFTVNIPYTLNLKGQWSASLLDISINLSTADESATIFATCSILVNSYVNEQMCKILRQISLRKKSKHRQTFSHPQYITIDNSGDINAINITILDAETLLPTLLPIEKVSCTLHIKRDHPPLLI
jgi:hypothetical protein